MKKIQLIITLLLLNLVICAQQHRSPYFAPSLAFNPIFTEIGVQGAPGARTDVEVRHCGTTMIRYRMFDENGNMVQTGNQNNLYYNIQKHEFDYTTGLWVPPANFPPTTTSFAVPTYDVAAPGVNAAHPYRFKYSYQMTNASPSTIFFTGETTILQSISGDPITLVSLDNTTGAPVNVCNETPNANGHYDIYNNLRLTAQLLAGNTNSLNNYRWYDHSVALLADNPVISISPDVPLFTTNTAIPGNSSIDATTQLYTTISSPPYTTLINTSNPNFTTSNLGVIEVIADYTYAIAGGGNSTCVTIARPIIRNCNVDLRVVCAVQSTTALLPNPATIPTYCQEVYSSGIPNAQSMDVSATDISVNPNVTYTKTINTSNLNNFSWPFAGQGGSLNVHSGQVQLDWASDQFPNENMFIPGHTYSVKLRGIMPNSTTTSPIYYQHLNTTFADGWGTPVTFTIASSPALPSITPLGPRGICPGQTLTLDGMIPSGSGYPAGFYIDNSSNPGTWQLQSGTNYNTTINAAGMYQIKTNYAANGCIGRSNIVTVVSHPTPSFNISGNESPNCYATENYMVTNTNASGTDLSSLTYSWSIDPSTAGTINSVTSNGQYANITWNSAPADINVTAHYEDGANCIQLNGLKVVPVCCSIAEDGQYIHWGDAAANQVTTNTTWDNKIYVQGTLTVPAGKFLDITNVDVVFSGCNSGIYVEPGGRISATNSTFRPCNINDSWKGIEFASNAESYIRECVFSNAFRAIDIEGNSNPGITRISNNHFVNNHVGVYINNSSGITENISGNTFVVENNNLAFCALDQYPLTALGGTNGFCGIQIVNSNIQGSIAQNDFTGNFHLYSEGTQLKVEFYGIYCYVTSVKITNNNFSNLTRSIELSSSNLSVISGNTITNSSLNSNQFQIRSNSGSYNDITNNNLNSTSFEINEGGINIEYENYDNIVGNVITGYDTPLKLSNSQITNIKSNNIEGGIKAGIYAEGNDKTDISCNEISMRSNVSPYDANTNSYGSGNNSGIYANNNSSTIVKGNCITNTNNGIVVSDVNSSFSMYIKNNFIYNFNQVGIYNNYGGVPDLGTSDVNYIHAGRNTIISNHLGIGNMSGTPVYDIYNNSYNYIPAFGNFTGSAIAGAWYNDNVGYHSNASCGKQIVDKYMYTNVNDYEDDFDKCDVTQSGSYTNYRMSNNNLQIEDPYFKFVKELNDAHKQFNQIKMTINLIKNHNANYTIDEFINKVKSEVKLSNDYLNLVNAYKSTVQKDFDNAMVSFTNVTDKDASVYQLELAKFKSIASIAQTSDEVAKIIAIANSNTEYADEAKDYIYSRSGNNTYQFKKTSLTNLDLSKPNLIRQNSINVYPNPGSDVVTLTISALNYSNIKLKVLNILGEEVLSMEPKFSYGQTQLDISNLNKGSYYFTVVTNDGIPLKTKFIKQ